MFGWSEPLSAEQTAEIRAAKEVIYDGFKAAIEGGVPKEKAGILVDEQFGAGILRDAAARGFTTAYPGGEERTQGARVRIRRGPPRAHRVLPSDVLQGAAALQPRGRSGAERAASGATEMAVGLSARQEPQPIHARAAGAGHEGAARSVRGRYASVRSEASPTAHGPSHRRSSRTKESSRTSGSSKASTGARTARGWWPPRTAAVETMSAASSSAEERATRRSMNGWPRPPASRATSALPWAGRASGIHSSRTERKRRRARRLSPRSPAASASSWTSSRGTLTRGGPLHKPTRSRAEPWIRENEKQPTPQRASCRHEP